MSGGLVNPAFCVQFWTVKGAKRKAAPHRASAAVIDHCSTVPLGALEAHLTSFNVSPVTASFFTTSTDGCVVIGSLGLRSV